MELWLGCQFIYKTRLHWFMPIGNKVEYVPVISWNVFNVTDFIFSWGECFLYVTTSVIFDTVSVFNKSYYIGQQRE